MRGDQFEDAITPEKSNSKQYIEWPSTSIDHVLDEKTSMISSARPILKVNNQEKKTPHLLIRSAIESTKPGLQTIMRAAKGYSLFALLGHVVLTLTPDNLHQLENHS